MLALAMGGFLLYRSNQAKLAAQRAEEARVAEENRQKSLAQEVVKAYYDALIAGDAERIKGLGPVPAGNAALLTKEVLAEAMKKAAPTDVKIEAGAVTATSGTIRASYTIAGKPVTVSHEVTRTGDTWRLEDIASERSLGTSGPARVVNGTEVPAGRYLMFPGGYAVGTNNPMLTATNGEFVVYDVTGATNTSRSVDFEVSEAGRTASLDAAKKALDGCLARRELAPAGCPMIRWRADPGTVPDNASLRFVVKGDPWSGVTPTCTATSLTCRVAYSVTVSASGKGTSPRGPVTLSGDLTSFVIARVSLESGQPVVTM